MICRIQSAAAAGAVGACVASVDIAVLIYSGSALSGSAAAVPVSSRAARTTGAMHFAIIVVLL